MSSLRRALLVAVGAVAAIAPGAQAALPQVLKPIHHTHAVEGTLATVTILLPARTDRPVRVAWETVPGTAKAGRDYTAANGTVTIPRGQRRASLTVRTLTDRVDELTEEFTVRFSNPVGAPLGKRTSSIVRIIDRNAEIASLANRRVKEPGPSGATTPIGAVVNLRGASAGVRPVSIGYEIVGVDATVNGDDATLGSGRLHFRRGETSKRIPGVIKGDTLDEIDEHLLIVLTTDRGVYARPGGTVTIIDDPNDTPPAISIGDFSAPEDTSGAVQVPLTLSAPSERPVTVTYSTSPGSATSPEDFVMKVGTVVFPPDTTTVNAPIVLNDDTDNEPNQTFTISLSNPKDATIDRGTATFTITDNDPLPIVTAKNVVVDESAGTATVTFKLSQPTQNVVTVSPTVSSHSARFGAACEVADSDPNPIDAVTPSDQPVTFAPGQTTASLVLTVCDDYKDEGDELVTFDLGTPTNATLSNPSVDVRIAANDPLPVITATGASVDEGAGGMETQFSAVAVTLTLDHPTGNTVTVTPTISGHTATFGSPCNQNISDPDPPDLITPPGDLTVMFQPFTTVAVINVTICDDVVMEALSEFVDFHFASPVNATLGNTTASLTITDNDQ